MHLLTLLSFLGCLALPLQRTGSTSAPQARDAGPPGELITGQYSSSQMRKIPVRFARASDISLTLGGSVVWLGQERAEEALRPSYGPWGFGYGAQQLLPDNIQALVAYDVDNTAGRAVEMPMVDAGVPPGFTVMAEGLESAVKEGSISRFSIASRQVILYLEQLDPGQKVRVRFELRARLPLRALTPVTTAYPYYNPEQVTLSAPQVLTVLERTEPDPGE
jgi:hypothetical protein